MKHERDSLDLLAAALLLIDSINSDPKVRRVPLRTEEVCKEFLDDLRIQQAWERPTAWVGIGAPRAVPLRLIACASMGLCSG